MKKLHRYLRDEFSAHVSINLNPYDWRVSLWMDREWGTFTCHFGLLSFGVNW